jgi:hypothetical protein
MDEIELFEMWWRIQPFAVREHILSLQPADALAVADVELLHQSIIREVATTELDDPASSFTARERLHGELPTLYRMSAPFIAFLDRQRCDRD